MYLELVYNTHEHAAKEFIAKFGPRQESYYQEDIKKLSFVTKKDHMKGNELMENFNTSQFTVRMSRDTYTQLRQQKKHLSEKKHTLLWNVIQEHLYLDVYEGLPRSKNQIDSTAGAVTGEANRQANKSKVCQMLETSIKPAKCFFFRFTMVCSESLMLPHFPKTTMRKRRMETSPKRRRKRKTFCPRNPKTIPMHQLQPECPSLR